MGFPEPEHFPSRDALPVDAAARLEHCAFTYGETYDSYLVTEGDREYFFSTGRRGVVGFKRSGRNVQVIGGLLADPDNQEELLHQFIEFVRSRRWRLTFFGVGRNSFKLYRSFGFQITKLGEEPIVVLDTTDWKGQTYEWLRRQEKGCLKAGLTVREIFPDAEGAAYVDRIAPELELVSREHLQATLHQREMKFFVGQFEPHDLGRRRLFVAETSSRIECFVVLNPCIEGSMWAIEIYRKRSDAVRGVIPFAMLQVMRLLKSEKVVYVSLSMIPCLRSDSAIGGDSWLLRKVSHGIWRYFNALYDVRGMYHFKSRFRPHWRELYVASLPGLGVTSIASMGFTWGLFRVNPLRLAASFWKDFFDSSRKSLAEPPWRPEQLIRELRRRDATTIESSLPNDCVAPEPEPIDGIAR
jgi:phosphatidylglycerol lysyltransferase